MSMSVTTALVYASTLGIRKKRMQFDEVVKLCKDNGLGVWDMGHEKVIDIDNYELKPVRMNLNSCFYGMSYIETAPEVDLVPFGTTFRYGKFVYPKN